MKYSPEFLTQKAVEMRSPRCPQFNKGQLNIMFKAINTTLRGGPETGWGLGGYPHTPELKKLVVGGKSHIPTELLEESIQNYGLGSFHTHPPPKDLPIRVPDVEKAVRDGMLRTLGPSYGDQYQSFTHHHQVLCVGGREEEQLGGKMLIKCYTAPEVDQVDWWDQHIWGKIYAKRDLQREYDQNWADERKKEEERKKSTEPYLIIDVYNDGLRRRNERIELKKKMDALEREIERDFMDYWTESCVYEWEKLPPMVGKS